MGQMVSSCVNGLRTPAVGCRVYTRAASCSLSGFSLRLRRCFLCGFDRLARKRSFARRLQTRPQGIHQVDAIIGRTLFGMSNWQALLLFGQQVLQGRLVVILEFLWLSA